MCHIQRDRAFVCEGSNQAPPRPSLWPAAVKILMEGSLHTLVHY